MDGQSPQSPAHRSRTGAGRSRQRGGVESGAHLLDRLSVVYRRRRIAAGLFLLIVLGVLLRTYTTVPLYRAHARLMLEVEDDRTAAMAGAIDAVEPRSWQEPRVYYETQYRMLTGRELARRVIHRLDLARVAEFAGGGPRPTALNRALAAVREKVMGPPAAAPAGVTSSSTAAPGYADATLVDAVIARVKVEPVPNSQLVDVAFVSSDAALAVRAANTLAEEFVAQNLELRRQHMVASLDWLVQELATQQRKVEASERAMAQYREDQNALSLEGRQNIVVSRLNQLNDAVTRAKTNRLQRESLYQQVENLDANVSAEAIPAILQNPYIQAVKTRLAELQREQTTLLERYGEKYPDVLKVNANLQDVTRQLQTEVAKAIDAIRIEYEAARLEERTLSAALEDQKSAAIDLDRKNVGYTVLEREARSNRQVYETLLQREKELQVLAGSRGNNVWIIERAEQVPAVPFTPTPARDLVLAIVAGLALSLGLVFLLDYLDDTIKSPDDVTDKLMIPLLGFSPKVAGPGQPLLSRAVPHEFGEAFRSLRTALLFSATEPTRVVTVTSAQPLEGKTTTAVNLAAALAIGGARVLLIDADMRRPGVHAALGLENATGLSHVLTGQASFEAATVEPGQPLAGLSVLTAGVPPPNPSELLGSARMKALLADVKNGRFDWVIVDTPPVLAVTDAVVLAPLVDSVAFVIGSEMTPRPHAARALDTLVAHGARSVGAVLNRVDLDRNKYYYSRYYGYKNRNYYFGSPAA